MTWPQGVGYLCAGLSALFNGSFAALSKVPSVAAANLDPVLFNFYVTIGVFLSSFLAAAVFPALGLPNGDEAKFLIAPTGMLGGALFVFAVLFSFAAIPLIGLSVGQGVWGAAAIFVSFLWGVIGPSEVSAPLRNVPLSLMALALLTVGCLGIVYCRELATKFCPAENEESARLYSNLEEVASETSVNAHAETATKNPLGFVFALLVGVFGGSVLVPLSFVPAEASGIAFVPSFGLGALVAGCIVTPVPFLVRRQRPEFHIKQTLWAGVLAGCIWNMSNICSILAMNYALVPYGVAYPLLQCALTFSGLWGIFIFKEIKGRAILVFFSGVAVLLSGAVLLGLFGPKKD
eukprot:TRINITY_DN2447_c0_g1_i1.p1 TRINITY_DN2447_c0_g1~~TRINITY_DN2447_c0_g1_i1.p1  ORF type:complete len:348 (-),score=52.89 TRINITY_DN2447_c0_g1_i1:423-1466(-)